MYTTDAHEFQIVIIYGDHFMFTETPLVLEKIIL